jgi:hypothetical protein
MYVLKWVSIGFLVVAAAAAPWPRATIEVNFTAIWCALLALSLATVPLQDVQGRHLRALIPVGLLMAGYAAAFWMQTATPPSSGLTNPIWAETGKLLAEPVSAHVVVNPSSAWLSLGGALCISLAFLSGFCNAIRAERARLFIILLGAVGTAYALYALSNLVYDNVGALLANKGVEVKSLREPFVNRNHAAAFYGTSSIIWFSLFLAEIESPLSSSRTRFLTAVQDLFEQSSFALPAIVFCFLGCLTALFLTQSRAGILLTLTALALCTGLFFYRTLSSHPKSILIGVGILVAAGLFVEVWGGAVAYRIGLQGLQDLERWEAYRSTVAMIRDHPLLGSGLGSFELVFPAYRTDRFDTSEVWDLAHNSILELAAEQGVIVALGLLLVIIYLMAFIARGVFIRRRQAHIPMIGLAILIMAASHSMVDFALQIPAYSIYFAAIVGCAFAQSFPSGPSRKSVQAPHGVQPSVSR